MYMLYLSFLTFLSMLVSSKRIAGRDWQTEFSARLFKRFFKAADRKGPQWSRKTLDEAGSKSLVVKRVDWETVELGVVSAQKATPRSVDADSLRINVYMHGGGYVTGSAKSYGAFVARLADQSKLLTYSLDYPLSPENPFPIPQEVSCKAIKEIAARHPKHQLVLIGDSAGAGLAISTALHAEAELRSRIAGLGLISPWVNPLAKTGSMVSNLPNDMFTLEILEASYAAHMQGAEPMDTRANFTEADLSSLPPLLIQGAGGEMFFDQIIEFSDRAKAQGVAVTTEVFDAQFHVFQVFAHHFEESKRARASLVAFARG